MRGRVIRLLVPLASVLVLVLPGTGTIAPSRAIADGPKTEGTWKLLVLAFGEDEFAIVKLSQKDGTTVASVVDPQRMIFGEKPQIKLVDDRDGKLAFTLTSPAGENEFEGKLVQDGANAGKYLGHFKFRGELYPASLVKTTSEKVAELKQSPLATEIRAAKSERDLKAKVKKLEEAIKKNHGSPNSQLLYNELLGVAEAAGLESQKVSDVIKQWTEESASYGEAWLGEVQLKALKAIGASKRFAKQGLELAQKVDLTLSDEALEKKALVAGLLARAARNNGMEDLAKQTEARRTKIDARLDEDYHKKVPPFKPTAFAGRKNARANQVVLMELFTGAQCPPCVAADVAFDGLLKTYKPTEFIGLQYHLHIPGPDPLTNKDSVERKEYYGSEVRGTPSTFFNGKGEAGGGGPMGASEGKYEEFRQIIDKSLETTREASITLTADRSGSQIKIVAAAQVDKADKDQKSSVDAKAKAQDEAKSTENSEKSKPVLRLVLTEESVRYVGGNKLRFHHHVVRAFPGGTKGKELTHGAGKVQLTFDLVNLRHDLDAYLSDFAKKQSFPYPQPEIKFEDLAVVAFVQDDDDKHVLGAVSVPVKQVNP